MLTNRMMRIALDRNKKSIRLSISNSRHPKNKRKTQKKGKWFVQLAILGSVAAAKTTQESQDFESMLELGEDLEQRAQKRKIKKRKHPALLR